MSAQSAGALLSRILTEPGRARRLWVAEAGGRIDPINIAAVCQVIAGHLWEYEGFADTDTELPRRIKDRVRRALQGEVVTRQTIDWFAGAFHFSATDRRRLSEALADSDAPRSIAGTADGSALPVARRYRTVTLHEHHYIGADRCPRLHRTTQVLQGTENSLATYLYMFDTSTIEVEVLQGGKVAGPVREIRDGLYGIDIELTRALEAGRTATITYESRFFYPEPPLPEFRRAAFHGVEAVDLRVQFDPLAVPVRVTFAEWPNVEDHEPVTERDIAIDADLSVHQWLRTVEDCVVGFRWWWE